MDRKTLVNDLNTANMVNNDAYLKLTLSLSKMFNDALADAGVADIAKALKPNDSSVEIEIPRPDHSFGYTISIYYHHPYSWEKKRRLELNIGCFGSFDATATPEINFHVVAGAIAKNLPSIQQKFDAIDFSEYEKTNTARWKAEEALRKFDAEANAFEKAKKMSEIEAKLVVGAKIHVKNGYDGKPIYATIERLTNKRVYLDTNYGHSTKKDEVLDNLALNRWKIVA